MPPGITRKAFSSNNFINLFLIAPYVKVYLLDGKTCIEKQRTRTTRRTLDPLIQQTLIFKENYRDKVLQVKKKNFYLLLEIVFFSLLL